MMSEYITLPEISFNRLSSLDIALKEALSVGSPFV